MMQVDLLRGIRTVALVLFLSLAAWSTIAHGRERMAIRQFAEEDTRPVDTSICK
jgi:hypothetical protein